jgi:ADP-ribose pyrophosphatase
MPFHTQVLRADSPDAGLRELRQSSDKILSGRFLQVFSDQVTLPDGKSTFREYIVHPGAVMVIPLLIDAQGHTRIVLERQFRYPVGQVMIELPAGKRDGQEDLLLCAQRELREETGYSATQWAHAGVLHPCISYSTEYIDIWFAQGLQAGQAQLDAGEFLEVFSASTDEFFAWCRDGRITDAKTLTGALWLQNYLSGNWPLQWQDAP